MRTLTVLAVLLAWPTAPTLAQAPAQAPLTVCMQQNDPPLSLRAGDAPSGFDFALAQVIAERLGRDLHVQWFVSRDDPDASMTGDTHALLSDGRCQLMAEYPLTTGTLESPRSPAAKLPPFEGAKPDDRRRWVKIADLAATRPYRLDTLTVVLSSRDSDRKVRTLADLDGLKLGVQLATLADAIAMQYGDGRLAEHVLHMANSRDLFTHLQSDELDAALVDTRAFDAWRLRHGAAGLAPSGYRHSLAFNMGFAGLASNRILIDQVDAILADLQAHDAIAPLAASAGLTFLPPAMPAVAPEVRLTALKGD
jgi:ABC-type amino acid transport substrate-binding protein